MRLRRRDGAEHRLYGQVLVIESQSTKKPANTAGGLFSGAENRCYRCKEGAGLGRLGGHPASPRSGPAPGRHDNHNDQHHEIRKFSLTVSLVRDFSALSPQWANLLGVVKPGFKEGTSYRGNAFGSWPLAFGP
jgi:hypothetical protein